MEVLYQLSYVGGEVPASYSGQERYIAWTGAGLPYPSSPGSGGLGSAAWTVLLT
jgi:hypothetical protein